MKISDFFRRKTTVKSLEHGKIGHITYGNGVWWCRDLSNDYGFNITIISDLSGPSEAQIIHLLEFSKKYKIIIKSTLDYLKENNFKLETKPYSYVVDDCEDTKIVSTLEYVSEDSSLVVGIDMVNFNPISFYCAD